jgi:50S ribosomal subunit-associated GTPase HflX
MVFDINKLDTLEDLENRFNTIIEEARVQDPVVFILGNKVDTLSGERAEEFVSVLTKLLQSIKSKMLEHHREGEVLPFLSYYEVSAKTGSNCKEVLQQLELQIAYRKVFGKPTIKDPKNLSLTREGSSDSSSGCCK